MMAFFRLPDELLDLIISYAIPEGFEGLCLTSRKLHTLCRPSIEQYNHLCSQFRNFNYYEKVADQSFTIRTSFELIARIAAEPIVARYIQHADFKMDLRPPVGPRLQLMEENGYRRNTVRDLFANSRYVAGVDWQEYYIEFEQGLEDNRYSQATAAFLLTLLPNVKSVILPQRWKSDEGTEKLLETVVEQARHSDSASNTASLSKLITLKTSVSLIERRGLALHKVTPLLALPQIRSFHGPSSVAHLAAGKYSTLRPSLQPTIGVNMETAHLLSCNLDAPAMEYFLRCTPHLKTLVYSHSSKQVTTPWKICELVTAIVDQAGGHLEELSITTYDFRDPIALGTTSMRAFTRLHKLEIPLDLATCVIKFAAQLELENSTKGDAVLAAELSHVHSLMCGLVPASVTRLFLRSNGWGHGDATAESSNDPQLIDKIPCFQGSPQHHDRTLEIIFRDFAAGKDTQLPALKEVRLSCPATASETYKSRCRTLLLEAEKVGVTMYLESVRSMSVMDWAES